MLSGLSIRDSCGYDYDAALLAWLRPWLQPAGHLADHRTPECINKRLVYLQAPHLSSIRYTKRAVVSDVPAGAGVGLSSARATRVGAMEKRFIAAAHTGR